MTSFIACSPARKAKNLDLSNIRSQSRPTRTPLNLSSCPTKQRGRKRNRFQSSIITTVNLFDCQKSDGEEYHPCSEENENENEIQGNNNDDTNNINIGQLLIENQKETETIPRSVRKKQKNQKCNLTQNFENISIADNANLNGNYRNNKNGMGRQSTSTAVKRTNNQKRKATTVRITKSERVFAKKHEFGELLVAPVENGSGCWIYLSTWNNLPSVTKLLPLFGNADFDEDENVDNALREFEYHSGLYRKAVKKYGSIEDCPICEIYAYVRMKHENQPYFALVLRKYDCNLFQFYKMYRKLSDDELQALLNCSFKFLSLAQEQTIIHNDIKAENIFLNFEDAYEFNDDDDSNENENENDSGFALDEGYAQLRITKFVYADFGCSVSINEEFPFGNLTGTLTTWDLTALGRKYGRENGCSYANDLYSVIVTAFDAFLGYVLIEDMLDEENTSWAALDWKPYTNLVRKCRAEIMDKNFILERIMDGDGNKKARFQRLFLQLAKKRRVRMDLKEMKQLFRSL